jgi:hypothetical protein
LAPLTRRPLTGKVVPRGSPGRPENAAERAGQHDLFSPAGIQVSNAVLAKRAAAVAQALPDNLEDLHIHQQRQAAELAESPERHTRKLVADAWCATFVQPKTEEARATAITQSILEQFDSGANTLELAAAEDLVADLTRQYRFFHWHVEFPHIFRTGNGATDIDPATGWSGGFSCVIGNPPWERVKLQKQEFFASRSPAIAQAPNAAARKKLIAALPDSDSPADRTLYQEFQAELRQAAGWSHLLRESGRYPSPAAATSTPTPSSPRQPARSLVPVAAAVSGPGGALEVGVGDLAGVDGSGQGENRPVTGPGQPGLRGTDQPVKQMLAVPGLEAGPSAAQLGLQVAAGFDGCSPGEAAGGQQDRGPRQVRVEIRVGQVVEPCLVDLGADRAPFR